MFEPFTLVNYGLRSAPVGAKPRSPGPRGPSAPERSVLCPLEVADTYHIETDEKIAPAKAGVFLLTNASDKFVASKNGN